MSSSIDRARRSVSLPRRLMPALLAVHSGELCPTDRVVSELRAGGLVDTDHLDPLVTTLIDVMTDPTLVVTVEVARSREPRLATIWGTPRRAVIGLAIAAHRFDLIQIEPSLLPFHLAQATGLQPRPRPPFSGGFTLPAATLNRTEDLMTEDLEAAERVLHAAGVPSRWTDRCLIALAHRVSLWSVESIWLGERRRTATQLSVLDAGPAGFWRVATNGETIRIDVTDFDDIMIRFANLLPTVQR